MMTINPDTCHLEEISETDKRKKSPSESTNLNSLNVGSDLCPNALNTQSTVILHKDSFQGNVEVSLRRTNDDSTEKSEPLEEDDNSMTFRNKRLKMTELSLPMGRSWIEDEAGFSLLDLPNGTNTPLDQPVEVQLVAHCFSGSMCEKDSTAGDDNPMEVVENTLLIEASNGYTKQLIDNLNENTNENGCDSDEVTTTQPQEESHIASNDAVLNLVPLETDARKFVGEASNDDNKLLTDKSSQNTNEKGCDSDMVTTTQPEENSHIASNDVVLNLVPPGTDASNSEGCSRDLFLHSGDNEKPFLVAKDASAVNQESCDSDNLASNLMVDLNDDAKKTCNLVDIGTLESKEENNSRYPVSPEKPLASDVGPSLNELGNSNGADSQTVGGSVSAAVDGSSSGSQRKKLLVLDVNGLLVDICSYVPYDYYPDEILLKKAIFKRPYCDDFLKFCFERFDVGVWTSRTKTNMEPILDYLFGNHKHKLLFRWNQLHCNITCFNTIEKRHKPLILKKLKKLWEKQIPGLPWEIGAYNETNTLLIDDSPYKAVCNPLYTAIFPYTYRFRNTQDKSLGPGGDLRVYLEGLAMAENVQEYVKQNPFGQRQITERNLSWGFYRRVIEAWTSPPRQTAQDDESST